MAGYWISKKVYFAVRNEAYSLTTTSPANTASLQPLLPTKLFGKIGYFVHRLLRFLTTLDQDVRIVVQPAHRQDRKGARGKISVVNL